MTDIIFIVDGCERSKACQASIKFFFESLKTSLCKEYIYHFLRYDSSAQWVWSIDGDFSYLSFADAKELKRESIFSQALLELSKMNIRWSGDKPCPVIIWLVGSRPTDDNSSLLSSLSGNDIMFNRAIRIAVSFGMAVPRSVLESFVAGYGSSFSSIEIEAVTAYIRKILSDKPLISQCDNVHKVESLIEKKNRELEDIRAKKKAEEDRLWRESNPIPQKKTYNSVEEKACDFSDGVFACKWNGKWGWVGVNGILFIPPTYNYVREFSEGFAAVSNSPSPEIKRNNDGYSNEASVNRFLKDTLALTKIIEEECEYYEAWEAKYTGKPYKPRKKSDVSSNNAGNLLINLKKTITPVNDEVRPRKAENPVSAEIERPTERVRPVWFYINILGEPITNAVYEEAKPFKNGLALVKRNGVWGAINTKGKEVVPCKYAKLKYGTDKVLIYATARPKTINGSITEEYGLMTYDGMAIPLVKYDNISDYKNGFAIARLGNTSFLINEKGVRLSEIKFRDVKLTDSYGLLIVSNVSDSVGVCAYDGSVIVPNRYKTVFVGKETILAKNDGQCFFFDLGGNRICMKSFSDGFLGNDCAIVKESRGLNRWLKIDKCGRETILPYKQVFYVFDNGNILTSEAYVENGKIYGAVWSLISDYHEVRSLIVFKEDSNFQGNTYYVVYNKKSGERICSTKNWLPFNRGREYGIARYNVYSNGALSLYDNFDFIGKNDFTKAIDVETGAKIIRKRKDSPIKLVLSDGKEFPDFKCQDISFVQDVK